MAILRTKSATTKLTDAEYERCEQQAGPLTMSEWLRLAALKAAQPDPLLKEMKALRMIITNLGYSLATGEKIDAEWMHDLVAEADKGEA